MPHQSDDLLKFISLLNTKLDKGDSTISGIWGNQNQAAVLVPILKEQDDLKFLFTKRTDFIATHKGQVSFPGGKAEKHDQDPVATALRETHEEIGAWENDIQVIGRMKPIARYDGLLITPVIGIINWPVKLKLSEMEVSKVFTVPLTWFMNEHHFEVREILDQRGNMRSVIYYRHYAEEIVWGLTAEIIHEFVKIIK